MAKNEKQIKKELIEARTRVTALCDMVSEDSPYYNYLMNGLMFVDEATRIAHGTAHLNPKWLHYYADKCI